MPGIADADPTHCMFKPGFNKYSVVDLCHPLHPDIVNNRARRWRDSFAKMVAGSFFDRPAHQPVVAHELHYHPPIFGRLQSSYVDVEAELEVMRNNDKHKHSTFMFVGGDGLAINRINHSLARHPGKYLHTRPAVIPVQGEHPHGTCHILHMGWRPYSALVVPLLEAIGHRECKSNFTVSDFNDHDHAMCILIEGIARYFMYLESQAGGMPPLSHAAILEKHCASNIDLEWLFHFLRDFGFMYWEMRQAVRSNNSHAIDYIWRECVSFLHTSEANKTQYAPMAILRIFWSEALHPALASIYHANRTISLVGLPGSNVGWDMPIEKENLMISCNVTRPTFERISHYVRQLNFLGPVSRSFEKVLLANQRRSPAKMKKIEADVQAIVDHLKLKVGATWADAREPRLQKDSVLVNPPRTPRPWLSVAAAAESGEFQKWVKGHIDDKVPWM
mmetsp:Transcript_23882/g.77118  ORF Transcript_23882/g.77118 Transcript_23882/m.77118 type:complete len:447 (+) Transcript_23882:755-2095(+)